MTTLEIILIASVTTLVMWQIFLSLFVNRQQTKLQKQIEQQQAQIKKVHQELQSMVSSTIGVGKRVRQLTDQMQDISLRQEEIELSGETNKPIEQAVELVKRGASVEDLMRTCDLSQGEAELLIMVHKESDGF